MSGGLLAGIGMQHAILVGATDAGHAGRLAAALGGRYRVRTAVGAEAIARALADGMDELLLVEEAMLYGSDGLALRVLLTGEGGAGIAVMAVPAQADSGRAGHGPHAAVHAIVLQGRVAMHFGLLHELAACDEFCSLDFAASALGTETEAHCRRTQHYLLRLAGAVRDSGHYRDGLGDDAIALMFHAAPFHDIGKAGIPAAILRKPGPLKAGEFAVVQRHTTLGYAVAMRAAMLAGAANPLLLQIGEIARCHHEKWDGSGYPAGLAREEIPLSARLMAVVDVYDALVSRRAYKDTMPHDEAVARIAEGCGSHFEPCLVEVFVSHAGEFPAIARRFRDGMPQALLATCL